MKTRTKKTPEPETPAKGRNGGHRPGAGRKPTHGTTMRAGLYIRVSEEQKAALTAYVETLSAERQAEGLSAVDLSTWIRELALKHSGNAHLGLAAVARRQAEAAASIV